MNRDDKRQLVNEGYVRYQVASYTRGGSNELDRAAIAVPGESYVDGSVREKAYRGKKILIVHSYHADVKGVIAKNEGMKSVLGQSGADFDFFYIICHIRKLGADANQSCDKSNRSCNAVDHWNLVDLR